MVYFVYQKGKICYIANIGSVFAIFCQTTGKEQQTHKTGEVQMKLHADSRNEKGIRNEMIYGGFLEHFHRQIYGGVYDPENPLSDESGFRKDVLEAVQRLKLPVLRWPGGCFVSSYHWMDGVGKERESTYDRTWRVEESNAFGTDEFIEFCRKVGCEPYICTNAGTGGAEEMSDWVEYCNMEKEGRFSRMRIANDHPQPHNVKYWSVGNENWSRWEIGAKTSGEWGRLVEESAKMMKRVDPTIELSAAALPDVDWNLNLLKQAGDFLDWISIHQYWDGLWQVNNYATYEEVMAYTAHTEDSIRKVRGLLNALGLEDRIRIAFDEWNLRGWYHPKIHAIEQGRTKEEYLYPRDENDDNTKYTMADAVFTACFLNTLNRNCDIVHMANYAPIINTRGYICTGAEGIVRRSTYYVFDLYVNYMGDVVLNEWTEGSPVKAVKNKEGKMENIQMLDALVTKFSDRSGLAVAIVNKEETDTHTVTLDMDGCGEVYCYYVDAPGTDSYNDFGHQEVEIRSEHLGSYERGMEVVVRPHTVSVFRIG